MWSKNKQVYAWKIAWPTQKPKIIQKRKTKKFWITSGRPDAGWRYKQYLAIHIFCFWLKRIYRLWSFMPHCMTPRRVTGKLWNVFQTLFWEAGKVYNLTFWKKKKKKIAHLFSRGICFWGLNMFMTDWVFFFLGETNCPPPPRTGVSTYRTPTPAPVLISRWDSL